MTRRIKKSVPKSLDANLVGSLTIKQLLAFADMNNADLSIRLVARMDDEKGKP